MEQSSSSESSNRSANHEISNFKKRKFRYLCPQGQTTASNPDPNNIYTLHTDSIAKANVHSTPRHLQWAVSDQEFLVVKSI
jgi:hypothetical protein